MAYDISNPGWIAPAFRGFDTEQGWELTKWLYADPLSNPMHADPSAWPRVGRVIFVQRTLNYTNVLAAATPVLQFAPSGGRNVIILERMGVATMTGPAQTLNPDLVLVQMQRTDGLITIETTALSNAFGSAELPYRPASPEMWYGNADYNVTITNNTGFTIAAARLCWTVAQLDTGR